MEYDYEKAHEQTQAPQAPQPEAPTIIPRDKRKSILNMWLNGMKEILSQGMLPRILISVRVDSHLEKKFQLNITYPGLTAKQALPLIGMAFEAVSRKVKSEEMKDGPQIIIPR